MKLANTGEKPFLTWPTPRQILLKVWTDCGSMIDQSFVLVWKQPCPRGKPTIIPLTFTGFSACDSLASWDATHSCPTQTPSHVPPPLRHSSHTFSTPPHPNPPSGSFCHLSFFPDFWSFISLVYTSHILILAVLCSFTPSGPVTFPFPTFSSPLHLLTSPDLTVNPLPSLTTTHCVSFLYVSILWKKKNTKPKKHFQSFCVFT